MSEPVISRKTYVWTLAGLLGLLCLTVMLAYLPLGPLHLAAGMLVSVSKMLLIMVFFMHLRVSRRVIWLAASVGFVMLTILIVLSLADYATRSWMP